MSIFRLPLKLLIAVGAALFIYFTYLFYLPHPAKDFKNETRYLLIRKGDTLGSTANKLKKIGAISSTANFIFFAKAFGYEKRLHPGRYEILPKYSISALIKMIAASRQIPLDVTIPEGYTIAQIGRALQATLDLDIEQFRDAAESRDLIDSLGLEIDNLEGYLFPDTYEFYYDEHPAGIIETLVGRFFASLPDSFEEKANKLGLDFQEAIILASIIEEEAIKDEERPIIAAVYLNRLRRGMKLECDPTVIYAIGNLNRPLVRKDLGYSSPYNTYLNYGLPPGPISNPGKKSLEAAVNPTNDKFLFFVARGDGSHIFSHTYSQHLSAIGRIKKMKRANIS